ncbi:Gfo/Idh/MocA family protein [Conexibacter sp. CPCC 206217]|uniref:Gfo/Idh/MocA family protein n=1 Tax=Conexibacter sp. CPCC 206217 TaxID=3064574 RepID=UPI00271A78FD|nr:Gfo/Idh/MocA family oxidoreductase [Conexibacter sp. CPCC 206217]MDO8210330.1 Gfo/Idh/MocA family oxidoreductase [Conexibacter sp. CPCC 206217]
MTRIGIAGLGSIGRRHAAAAVRAGHEVVAFDPAPAGGGDPWVAVASFGALLDSAPTALVVATPDALHAQQAVAALERGIPVLVEKPLAASLDEALAIAAAARRSGTPALVGYVLRYNAALSAAARVLARGELGELVSFHVQLGAYETLVRAHSRFDGPAVRGGLYGDYSHEWDYVRWLLGPIVRGLAAERTVRGLERVQAPNVVSGLLELAGGLVGTYHLDYVTDPPQRALTVLGAAARLEVDVPAATLRLFPRGIPEADARVTRFAQPRDDTFDAQLAHMLDVARGEAQPRASVADGVRALAVAIGLRDAAASRAWVDFEDDERNHQMKSRLQHTERSV